MNPSNENLIWIDLEMTGLNPATDSILEIATVVTDSELNLVAQGPVFAIQHPIETLNAMDDWNRNQHSKSGLWDRSLNGGVSMQEAELGTIEFLKLHVAPGTSPMCGNSICQDRRFLAPLMPELEKFFHYRQIDVSSIKELARRWAPQMLQGFNKRSAHTALSDIEDSIDELKHYRQFLGAFTSPQA